MKITPIKTRSFLPEGDIVFDEIKKKLKGKLKENCILVVTSKVVSIEEGSVCRIKNKKEKEELIKKEAEKYLPKHKLAEHEFILTIKHNVLLPSAGIDESNADGWVILSPKDPFASARKIRKILRKEFGLKNLGVIVSDSHCVPMRIGTVGVSLGFAGFCPTRDYRNTKDIFGRKIEYSRLNIADSLAAAAVMVMGEGDEKTPLAIISDIKNIKFSDKNYKNDFLISPDEDLFYPILTKFK